MPHLSVTGVRWALTAAPQPSSGTAVALHPGGAATCPVPAMLTAPYLGAAACAIAFLKLGAVGPSPTAPLAKLGNPTAPPSHGAQTSISARACPTSPGELPDPAGEQACEGGEKSG